MFQDIYKQNINRHERQEERRKQLLKQQKLKRLEEQDEQRKFNDKPTGKIGQHSYRKRHINSDIVNVDLQLSEWLKEKPENFDEWFLMPCPKGQRCLVVSSKGETKMFSKNKRYCMSFSSLLPGGGLIGSKHDSCILDCIYNKDIDMFYVLDALHYSIPLKDCETEFRLFWLKSKFSELEDTMEEYKIDELKSFKLLNYYDMANEERIAMVLQSYPLWPDNQPELDGYLFYHKESHYVYGSTPLVCWLFPFMISDVLNMQVNSCYQSPGNYCSDNYWQYMEEFDKELAHKHSRRKNKQLEEMELQGTIDKEELASRMEEDQEDNLLQTILSAEKSLELEGES